MPYGQEEQHDYFTGPLLKALKIQQYIKDQAFQDEQRVALRERMKMELDDARRKRTTEDFNTALTLNKIGAIPALPGDTGANDEALAVAADITPEGRRPLMNTPIGNYRIPSRMDQRKRAVEDQQIAQAGKFGDAYATATGRAAAEDATAVEMEFPEVGKVKVPRAQIVNAIKAQQDLKANKYSAHSFQKDDQGNTTFVGIPQNGGEPVKIPLGQIGTSNSTSGKEPLPTNAEVEALMNEWRSNLYNSRGITQEVIDASKGTGDSGSLFGGEGNPAAVRIRAAEKELRDAAEAEIKARIRNKSIQGSQKPAGASQSLKVGDTKMVRGKQMRITKVYPDGSFDAQ